EARNVLSVDKGNPRAKEILDRATGGLESGKAKPSAFQVDAAGKAPPPSPFSSRAAKDTDALLAQFEFEPSPPGEAASARPQASDRSGTAPPLDLELPSAEVVGASGGPGVEAKIKALIEEGEGQFANKKYDAAIEVWSRIYALDRTHREAGALID